MRAIVSVLFVLIVFQGAALAQPGQSPAGPMPAPAPYPPPMQPQPYPYPYAPYQYGTPLPLTADEQELLSRGEISDGQHIGGGLVSLFFGFGVGQAVQGRYSDTGWIFTLGEAASMTAIFVGMVQAFDCVDDFEGSSCNNDDSAGFLLVGGLIGIGVFRIWEIVDAFSGPTRHNAKVRALRMRLGIPQPMYTKVMPYVAPSLSRDGGGTAGLTLRF
jgi:hypothetical protein